MKILHFITSLKIGGAESSLYNLLEHCKAHNDHEHDHCVLYLYDGPFVEKIKALGIPVYKLKGIVRPYDFVSWYRLCRLVRQLKPDVIHSALWSANIMARIVVRLYRIPLICDLHSDCGFHGRIRNFFDRVTLSIPDKFVAVSHSVHRSFLHNFGKNTNVSLNTIVIQNGIDAKKLRQRAAENPLTREELGLLPTDFVVGSVGRLHSIKRYDLLIKSFALFFTKSGDNSRIPHLCLVGDGPERSSLEQLTRDLGITKNVLFVGGQSEPYRYYPLFDCFVLSSQTEGLSIALLESLSFFLPAVITHDSQSHDVITNGINGLLLRVDKKNYEQALFHGISTIYKEKRLVDSIRKANMVLIERRFCIRSVRKAYDSLYKEVVKTE